MGPSCLVCVPSVLCGVTNVVNVSQLLCQTPVIFSPIDHLTTLAVTNNIFTGMVRGGSVYLEWGGVCT